MKKSRKNVKTIRYCGTAAVLAGILMLSPLAAAGAEPVPEQSAAEVTDAAGAAESSDTAGTEALPDQAAAQQTPETSESSATEIRVHLASEPGDPVPYKTMDLDTASLLKQISQTGTAIVMTTHNIPMLDKFPGIVYRCKDGSMQDVTNDYNQMDLTDEGEES